MAGLDGIRVLDLTRLLPGPLATLILADLGATVDKVEDAAAGDYARITPPMAGESSMMFHTLNRGKRGMVLDLKKSQGVAALKRMVKHYDVVMEQFRPGVLERLGVGHETLLAENPRLVVCALTGYGQTGPLAKRAGHDLNYMARAGLLGAMGPRDSAPQTPSFQLADVSGGMWSVIGILSALREREQRGKGQIVDIGMIESVMPFAIPVMMKALAGEAVERGHEMLTGGLAIYQTYLTKDGGAIAFGALEPKFFQKFFGAVGMEADFSAVMPGDHQLQLQQKLTEIFVSKTRDEWAVFNDEHDCCLEPVLRSDELTSDAHLKERGVFFDVETNEGTVKQLRTPVTPHDYKPTSAPKKGEHTDEILKDAGFDDAEIQALRDAGAVA